ncbi:Protein kinase superfamily protein [Euphorbia peplus]|nr:Protein kinase superfamily protein [Euphorbia peplus]
MGSIGEKKVTEVTLSARCNRLTKGLGWLKDGDIEAFLKLQDTKYLGKFQFGDVYMGTYDSRDVVVKIFETQDLPGENDDAEEFFWRKGTWETLGRLEDEIVLHDYFGWYEFHPNLAKLQYHCRGPKIFAAIYHVPSLAIDTLHNLIEKDDFAWRNRIKVAFGLASLLRYMHTPHPKCPSDVPYLIRNIDAAHILVDRDHEALLFDLSMISGGILTDKRDLLNQKIRGCSGYSDPIYARPGKWSDTCDVFSYGAVLLSLISKSVYKEGIASERPVYLQAWDKHKLYETVSPGVNKFSLVDNSLKSEQDFDFKDAVATTNIAMKCVNPEPQKRPTMNEVVWHMQKLCIVQQNADTWECCRMLDGVNEIFLSEYILKDSRVKWQASILDEDLSHKNQKPNLKDLDQSPTSSKSSIGEDNVIKVFRYKELIMATGGFSNKNLIGSFQFGKMFRGETEENEKVTVKIWETITGDQLRDEISLLQHPKLLSHRNVVKMIGYCFEEGKLGGVYALDPLDSLHNLAPKDDFSWPLRMKVIYELAKLLEFLHAPNPPYAAYRVDNIDTAHIILDKEYSPKLLDFGMTVGGIILSLREERTKKVRESHSYAWDSRQDSFYEARDIFAFGCIILCLLHKRVPIPDLDVDDTFYPHHDARIARDRHIYRAKRKHSARVKRNHSARVKRKERENSYGFSFVHKSLEKEVDENDGVEVTKLAMECVDAYRPSMEEVVTRLGNLHVIKKMGIQKLYEVQC